MKIRATYAAISLIFLVAAASSSTAQDYARFAFYAADGWAVTDKGAERCHADFAFDGDTVLSLMGPYYHGSEGLSTGRIIHLGEAHYTLPKGDRHGEFPVELIAGPAHFKASGFATDLGGALVADSGSLPTVIDLLAALPDEVVLEARVEGRKVYAIQLAGTRAAAKAFEDCTAFITAQKRPGTRNGPKLSAPKPPALEVSPARAQSSSGPSSPGLPKVPPPNPVSPLSF